MTDFSWKGLQGVLAASPFLEPDDDLSTQRGLVAASAAIMDRMSNCEKMREVTWTPIRMSQAIPAATRPAPRPFEGTPTAMVLRPIPLPRSPGPTPAYADDPQVFQSEAMEKAATWF